MFVTYMGKDWSQCTQLFEIYKIEDPRTTMFFMKMYEATLVKYRMEKAEEKRKQEERRAQQGGKTYTHNVRG